MSGRSHLLPGEAEAVGTTLGSFSGSKQMQGWQLDPLPLRHLEVGFLFLEKLTIGA
jgi:hypothetical protein